MNELVSIVVPVYNVEKYLERCVKSVLKQNYNNFELILVDDGSTDASGLICDQIKEQDRRIIVIHKINGGLSDARNVGIKSAKGKFITFLDSDDYIKFDYLKTLMTMIRQNNADISVCTYQRVYTEDLVEYENQSDKFKVFTGKDALRLLLYSPKDIPVSAGAKLYKRELFDGVEYPVGRLHEDMATTYKLFLKSNAIAYTSKPYYYYFQRSGGIVHSEFNIRKLDALYLSEKMLSDIMASYPELVKPAICYVFAQCVQIIINMPNERNVYVKERTLVMNTIEKYRSVVIKDKNAPFIKRIGAFATYFGIGNIKKLGSLYKLVINKEKV